MTSKIDLLTADKCVLILNHAFKEKLYTFKIVYALCSWPSNATTKDVNFLSIVLRRNRNSTVWAPGRQIIIRIKKPPQTQHSAAPIITGTPQHPPIRQPLHELHITHNAFTTTSYCSPARPFTIPPLHACMNSSTLPLLPEPASSPYIDLPVPMSSPGQ